MNLVSLRLQEREPRKQNVNGRVGQCWLQPDTPTSLRHSECLDLRRRELLNWTQPCGTGQVCLVTPAQPPDPVAHLCLLSHSVVSNSCDPMDCSLPDSSVHGILQARTLAWAAISSSRGSS